LSLDGDLRGAVDSQATTQIFLFVDTDPEIFQYSCCDAAFCNFYVLGTGKLLRLANKQNHTNYVSGAGRNEWGAKQNPSRFANLSI